MSISCYSILPATKGELLIIGGFLHASKLQLAINRFLIKDWPNEAVQLTLYTGSVESGFKDPNTITLKVVDDRSGELVGFLVLTRPESRELELVVDTDGKQNVPNGIVPEVYSKLVAMVKEIDKEREKIDHIQLTYMYVRPSNRKQGIGSQLVRLAVDKSKAARLPLFVTSEPAAHGFFLKQGFEDTKHVDIDLSQWAPGHSGWGIFRLSGMKMSF